MRFAIIALLAAYVAAEDSTECKKHKTDNEKLYSCAVNSDKKWMCACDDAAKDLAGCKDVVKADQDKAIALVSEGGKTWTDAGCKAATKTTDDKKDTTEKTDDTTKDGATGMGLTSAVIVAALATMAY